VSPDGQKKITVPRAVVWGADDNVDSVASGRATAAALGVPLELVPGAGHLSMLAQPVGVALRVLRASSHSTFG
jgi:pimeloyl-ACP methyl ester carboxylesterase